MSSWLLITNANVIDGTGAEPRPQTSVLIKDKLIHRIGDADALRHEAPESTRVEVIDATGQDASCRGSSTRTAT